jgi:hypothetical protein
MSMHVHALEVHCSRSHTSNVCAKECAWDEVVAVTLWLSKRAGVL